ncbi:beta-mannosidase [Compostimonas suwonensis]|uniref:Beta-mannosidase n=2 Tax=Compostimonas suwonensis TaxID=1048394 RepID=A0A2M9BVV3_9MICO|nr:beta-mannosidase [Compostimonas suwonensis]
MAREQLPLQSGWEVCRMATVVDRAAFASGAALPDDAESYPARVPNSVHEVLLEAGRISDPHNGDNAEQSAWVGDEDWGFRVSFDTPELDGRSPWLVFEGVDTVAEGFLNGRAVQSFDDMFLRYEIEVGALLAPVGEPNLLALEVRSPSAAIAEIVPPEEHGGRVIPHRYLRKGSGDFTSYLGVRPESLKVGIPGEVRLELRPSSWIDDVRILSRIGDEDGSGTGVDVAVEVSGGAAGGWHLEWALTGPDGALLVSGDEARGSSAWNIPIVDPQLWWPRTHGSSPLYALAVRLVVEGAVADESEQRFGLRTISLDTDDAATGEERFRFSVNGTPIYMMGANWIPVEGITNAWRGDRARRLLDLAEEAGMNLLRVWGGGLVPDDEFYEECDHRGILVWQDFMFGYGVYPADQPAFIARVSEEARAQVRRLRNHPCVLVWVGGNENFFAWDLEFGEPSFGQQLFAEVLPAICAELDPSRPMHVNSPWGGGPYSNWPLSGDWHDDSTLKYSYKSSVPTFTAELGRVSTPSLQSMRRFMSEDELWPADFDPAVSRPGLIAWPEMWSHRAPGGAWERIGRIEDFCEPAGPGDLIRSLGIAHGEYLRASVERHRRGRPNGDRGATRRSWGDIVWRLNDTWPTIYWSVIDSYLQPKIAFHYLRRAFDPVLVSFEQTPDDLGVWVTNDSTDAVDGELALERLRFDGTVIGRLAVPVSVAPGQSLRVADAAPLGPVFVRDELLRARFRGRDVTWIFTGERYLNLLDAALDVTLDGDELVVTTDRYARQVVLDFDESLPISVSDNYFDLAPGGRAVVGVSGRADGDRIRVSALNASEREVGAQESGAPAAETVLETTAGAA